MVKKPVRIEDGTKIYEPDATVRCKVQADLDDDAVLYDDPQGLGVRDPDPQFFVADVDDNKDRQAFYFRNYRRC